MRNKPGSDNKKTNYRDSKKTDYRDSEKTDYRDSKKTSSNTDKSKEKRSFEGKRTFSKDTAESKKFSKPYPRKRKEETLKPSSDLIRLNRYIANAGVCSRREADTLITAGAISINGKIVTELGTKVSPGDVVNYGKQRLSTEKKAYFLLNKPKDYITTMDDPQGRKNVMDLMRGACKERIFPVGRLDRNTTGLLLFTNDGELAKKLTHPKYNVKKIYHVHLDKKLTKADMDKILAGVKIDDDIIAADNLSYVEGGDNKKEIGVEIHSGQNRIVRRIFESLGYTVIKLDRVEFAGLTKKDLPKGKYRKLLDKEIGFLKMLK